MGGGDEGNGSSRESVVSLTMGELRNVMLWVMHVCMGYKISTILKALP
jgi:hypothetical protein